MFYTVSQTLASLLGEINCSGNQKCFGRLIRYLLCLMEGEVERVSISGN
jgi:hypothetical protein